MGENKASKRFSVIIFSLTALMILFAWIHSCFPADLSSQESNGFFQIFYSFFGLFGAEEALTEYLCGTDDALTARYLEGDAIPEAELQARLIQLTHAGQAHPVLYGSALRDEGIDRLLDTIVTCLPPPDTNQAELCGVVFAAAHDPVMGRGVWVRLYGGRLENRMAVDLVTGRDRVTGQEITVQRKISQIRDASGKDIGTLESGRAGVVYGLGDIEIGHVFGDAQRLPRKVQPGLFRTPLITVQVIPASPDQMPALREACAVLSSEDPLLHARYARAAGEMHVQVMGKVQLEILQEVMQTRFGLTVSFGEPAVMYRETIRQRATGFVAYTMPKPCWAVLEFDIQPGPGAAGSRFPPWCRGRTSCPGISTRWSRRCPQRSARGGWAGR